MTTKHTPRSRIQRLGFGTLVAGIILAVTGLAAAPAGAAGNDHQITICHATGSAQNPYSTPNPNKWQIMSPNGHGYDVDDIIPPFAAGSKGNHTWPAFPGLNWDAEGQAIYDAGCNQVPPPATGSVTLDKVTAGEGQPAGTTSYDFSVSCESGTVPDTTPTITPESPALTVATGVEVGDSCTITETNAAGAASTTFSVDGGAEAAGPAVVTITDPEQVISVLVTNTYQCPAGQNPDGQGGCTTPVDVCPDLAGSQSDPLQCPAPVDQCPTIAGVQTDAAQCPTVVEGTTVTPSTPAAATPTAPATQVEGAQLTRSAELPRTGTGTSRVALLGFGLVLMGAGALVFGREHPIAC